MKASCLHNEEQAALNYCTKRLRNKPSLDVGHNLQHAPACFDVAPSAASKVLYVVFGIDKVGGIRVNRLSTKSDASGHQGQRNVLQFLSILDDFLDSTQISAKGFDHKLQAVACSCHQLPAIRSLSASGRQANKRLHISKC